MSYELTLNIEEDSPALRNIEAIVQSEHLTREAAAIRLLEGVPVALGTPRPMTAERRAAIEAAYGFAKGHDWLVDEYEEEKRADIERENKRDLI